MGFPLPEMLFTSLSTHLTPAMLTAPLPHQAVHSFSVLLGRLLHLLFIFYDFGFDVLAHYLLHAVTTTPPQPSGLPHSPLAHKASNCVSGPSCPPCPSQWGYSSACVMVLNECLLTAVGSRAKDTGQESKEGEETASTRGPFQVTCMLIG